MFDIKKFTAFIAFNDDLRNLYYDKAESMGINSTWDVYHIQDGTELPSPREIEIMKDIFESKIQIDNALRIEYNTADSDFRRKVSSKVRNPR
jgi:hypothetical protein